MHDFAPKHVDRPRPGFFKHRAAPRSKVWIPVRIWRPLPLDPDTGEVLDRYPLLVAERGDQIIEEHARILDFWSYLREIDIGEYEWLKKVEWPLMRR